ADGRSRPRRHRRQQRPARSRSRAGRRRRCDLQRRSPVPRRQRGRRRPQSMAQRDRQGRGLKPRHIVAGHQNKKLDDDAARTIAETRRYLDDADELLRTEKTAVGFFNAKIARYPNHLARTVLWASAAGLYGVRERLGEDVGQILAAAWL